MDPWSGLQCASAVLSFVSLAGSVLSKTFKIRTGSTDLHATRDDLRLIADSLRTMKTDINTLSNRSNSALPRKNGDIADLCGASMRIADELITNIDKISGPNGASPSVWNSLRQALLTIWNQEELEDLQKRLDLLQQQIQVLISGAIRDDVSLMRKNQAANHRDSTNIALETQQLAKRLADSLQQSEGWHAGILRALERSSITGPGPVRETSSGFSSDKAMNTWKNFIIDNFTTKLMEELRYREMEDRYESILVAHADTFEWIFKPPPKDQEWASFTEWLQSSRAESYWITGKPGSGKSTLMKFICDSPTTIKHLETWAGNNHLLALSFYFWSPGTEAQWSQGGLLRRLLYNALEKLRRFTVDNPDEYRALVSAVFRDRLKAFMLFGESATWAEAWTQPELSRLLRTLIQAISENTCTVFLIDGLDEFGGAPKDIIDLFKSLYSPRVKLCASSRPWPVFEDTFSQSPSLRMEDLTGGDIRQFVTSKVAKSPGFRALQDYDEDGTHRLIQEIVGKAQGVFLWVYLVTGQLLEALSDGEPLSDLQRHIEALPADLTSLFDRIILTLQSDPIRYKRTTELFSILMAANKPLRAIELSFALEADPEFGIKLRVQQMSLREEKARAELVRRRVVAFSKCLFEVRRKHRLPLAHSPVEVIHRTVHDYLNSRQLLGTSVPSSGDYFNPDVRLCSAQLARIKTMPKNIRWGSSAENFDESYIGDYIIYEKMKDAIEYCKKLGQPRYFQLQNRLLQEVNRAAVELTGYNTIARAAVVYENPSEKNNEADDATTMDWPCQHKSCRANSALLYLTQARGMIEYTRVHLMDIDERCRDIYEDTIFHPNFSPKNDSRTSSPPLNPVPSSPYSSSLPTRLQTPDHPKLHRYKGRFRSLLSGIFK